MALALVLYFSPVYPSTSLDSEIKLLVYTAFIAQCYFCDSIATKILEEDVGIFCPIFFDKYLSLGLPTHPLVTAYIAFSSALERNGKLTEAGENLLISADI